MQDSPYERDTVHARRGGGVAAVLRDGLQLPALQARIPTYPDTKCRRSRT